MARKKHEKVDLGGGGGGGLGALGDLLAAQGLGASAAPPEAPQPPPAPEERGRPGRVVLRCERKGRGGKTVTTLTNHGLAPEPLAALAKRLRKALGCGAGVEAETVVLSGDQRDGAARLLEADGWRVVRG